MFWLKTFGGVSLEHDGRPLGGRASQRRRLALLAYLAATGGRPASRDKLIALLWPERDQERGRHSLSQMLWALRHELGEAAVLAGIDDVRLNPDVVASDLRDLEDALAGQDWERAVAGYPGPFLDGFFIADAPEFERWVGEKRDAIAGAVAGAYEALARAATARSDHLAAAGWWRQRVGLDLLDARLALRLMESLAASGDRAGAIRHAAVHSQLLHGELDAPPDAAVEQLAATLKRDGKGQGATVRPIPAVLSSARPAVGSAAPSVSTPRLRLWLLRVSALTALLVAAVLIGRPDSAVTPATSRSVVLGSFEGTDSSLALAVREAFRAELVREGRVRLLPEHEVAEALRLMQLPDGTRLSGPVARDVAVREGASYAITGTATPLGSGVLLAIHVVDPVPHASILSLSARPERRENVISEVVRLASVVRVRLGALPVDTATQALPAVTTASLEALEQYALARRAMSLGERLTAITLGEGALAHDSLFVLAHYLVGDLLWFTDQQRHSEAHLRRAQALAGLAPVREQFLVRARYQQLVADRPDSALSYYLQLRAAYPDEVLAYEGMAWTLRALGEHRAAAAVSDTALRLGAGVIPTLNNRLYALISAGDTVEALATTREYSGLYPGPFREARYLTALLRRDWTGALATLDREFFDSTAIARRFSYLYRRHAPLLALGRLADGHTVMEEILELVPTSQSVPRALILQAIAEEEEGDRHKAARLARRAKAWVDEADLSAAAFARLYERLAILGAWLGDAELIDSVHVAIDRRDGGRDLRSFVLVRETVAGAALFLRGKSSEAAGQLAAARRENFHARSTSSLGMLEADALARGGARDRAVVLYRAIESFRIPDTDFEIWPVLSRLATRRLASLGKSGALKSGA